MPQTSYRVTNKRKCSPFKLEEGRKPTLAISPSSARNFIGGVRTDAIFPTPPRTSFQPTTMATPIQYTPAASTPTGYLPELPQPQAVASTSSAAQQPSRQALEDARKDRTLAEFMLMLDDYEPLVRSLSCLYVISNSEPIDSK
jgi:hypothetical protein